ILYIKVNSYDERVNHIEESECGPDGAVMSNILMRHRHDGTMKESISIRRDRSKTVIRYNDKGNPIEQITYSADGNLFLKQITLFDEKANPVEIDTYDANGVLSERMVLRSGGPASSNTFSTSFTSEITTYKADGTLLSK